jgi:hypothetical protein
MNDIELLARGTRWQPVETRVVKNAAKRLLAGRYVTLNAATDACLMRLREWYAELPGVRKSGRAYPRTFAAIRDRLYRTAVARGYQMSPYLWSPQERCLAYKWTRKFLRHQKDRPPLARLDAGRGLLVELFEAGYDRTLDSCTSELDKCREDFEQGVPRHCGHGRAAIQLPPDVLHGTRRSARSRKAPASGA